MCGATLCLQNGKQSRLDKRLGLSSRNAALKGYWAKLAGPAGKCGGRAIHGGRRSWPCRHARLGLRRRHQYWDPRARRAAATGLGVSRPRTANDGDRQAGPTAGTELVQKLDEPGHRRCPGPMTRRCGRARKVQERRRAEGLDKALGLHSRRRTRSRGNGWCGAGSGLAGMPNLRLPGCLRRRQRQRGAQTRLPLGRWPVFQAWTGMGRSRSGTTIVEHGTLERWRLVRLGDQKVNTSPRLGPIKRFDAYIRGALNICLGGRPTRE